MRDLIDHTQTRWDHTSSKGNNLQNPNFLGLGVRKNEMTLKAINSQGTTELRKMVDHSTSQDIPDSARKRRKSVTNQGGNLKKNESLAEKSKTKASSWRNFMKTNSDDRSDSADEVVDDQRMLYSHRSVGKSQRELIHVAKDQIDNIIELKGYRIIYPWNI
jgi:CRP-like cAMP-binding protein